MTTDSNKIQALMEKKEQDLASFIKARDAYDKALATCQVAGEIRDQWMRTFMASQQELENARREIHRDHSS